MTSAQQRECLKEVLTLGSTLDRERTRHKNANEKLMVQAANTVYAAHLVGAVDASGYTPPHSGGLGKGEARQAAYDGKIITAKALALILGFSEAYVSRLYRLGFGIASGVLDPEETPEGDSGAKTRWQLVSRTLGDTPEVGAVLGKEASTLPTGEMIDAAVTAAQERKQRERADRAAQRAQEPEGAIPSRPSEQIDLLEEVIGALKSGRHVTPRQIARVQGCLDELREFIEDWMHTAEGQATVEVSNGGPRVPASSTTD